MKGFGSVKVSVITLQNGYNYGSVLQAFATQEKMKKHNASVEIIDYVRKGYSMIDMIKAAFGRGFLKGVVYLPTAVRWRYILSRFIKSKLNTSDSRYTDRDNINKYPIHDGVYFTGSDQVWNTDYNQGIVPPLYLSFIPPEKRKFSYASSFGKDHFTGDEIKKTQHYIDQYEQISVRENSGVKVLKEQYHYQNVIRIVDPVLALPPEFWRESAPRSKISKDYILIYKISHDAAFDAYARKLAAITGLHVFRLCPTYAQMFSYGKSILIPEIFSFVSLIDNAKYVLTDSFHGTAFSLNLNTEPICVYPEKYSDRISDLLCLTGTENRKVMDHKDFGVLNRSINWEHVNTILVKERERVDQFLKGIFS